MSPSVNRWRLDLMPLDVLGVSNRCWNYPTAKLQKANTEIGGIKAILTTRRYADLIKKYKLMTIPTAITKIRTLRGSAFWA